MLICDIRPLVVSNQRFIAGKWLEALGNMLGLQGKEVLSALRIRCLYL